MRRASPCPKSVFLLGLLFAGMFFVPGVNLTAREMDLSLQEEGPKLQTMTVAEAKDRSLAVLRGQGVDAVTMASAEALWGVDAEAPDGPELLDRVALTLSLGDERARELVDFCAQAPHTGKFPDRGWLYEEGIDPWVRNNLRLVFGRWFSHARLYDESLEQLAGIAPSEVVDPGSLLFYRAVAHHRLLHSQEGIEDLNLLLENVEQAPRRYLAVAALMLEDLRSLKEDSLDHVAREMDDIRRRLDIGQAGKKVITIEDDVIARLDKMIKEMEEQQQQQQQASSSSPGNARPSSPMDDSRPAELKGPGEVNKKDIGKTAGWGDLPPKQREEALQQIGKDFPSHYRDAVEQYFRKLAGEKQR